MRNLNLPARVLLVAFAAIFPFALLCGFALHALLAGQRTQIEGTTLSVARALASAVDGELRGTVASLEALALTRPLASDDLSGLADAYALVGAVRASHPEWRAVLLTGPQGNVIFSTERPFGPARETVVDPESLSELVQTKRAVIGPLRLGPAGNLAFAVRVPVFRDGVLLHALTAVVRPEAISSVLSRQQVPPGWAVSVFDANLARVARSVGDDRRRGQPPSATLQRLITQLGPRTEVTGTTENVDGVSVQTAVVRLGAAPWVIAMGAATSLANDAISSTVLAYGGGLLASILLSGFAGWWMSRAITKPMTRLRDSAIALGQGAPVAVRHCGIGEIDAVADALVQAAADSEVHQGEREQLLQAEHQARAKAEAAEQRLQRLVQASALLSRSLEESATLETIGNLVVPEFADICRIDLLDDDNVLQRKFTRHVDPLTSREIARMVGMRSAPADTPGTFPWVVATGKTFVLNLLDPALPEIEDPALREFALALQLTAGCVVPLVARGRTIGAMAVLQAESKRQFDDEDVALIGELAQRASLALDNVRLLAQARAAQAQSEVASKAKDEFLAMLGHELRNPLAPISLALQLIARKDAAAFPRERQIIERQVVHLSRMVDDLLDVSRVVAGKIHLNPALIDLRDVVAQSLELVGPAMQQRGHRPAVSLPDSPVPVRGEATRLKQVIGNLLANAAKFTESPKAITVALRTEGEQAVLTVADEGCGIDPALLPHIFEQFVQAKQQLQRAAGGLGLGLAIAHSLTRLHGGTIEASSEGAGQGSCFTLRLPLDTLPRVATPEPARADPDPSARGLDVLLIDDNEDALVMLADWFRSEGCHIQTASCAEEGLTLLQGHRFDACVCDIGLPGMSGYQLAERVRLDARLKPLPLVALTGYGQPTDKLKASAAGFDAHFSKPAPVEEMLRAIQRLVAERSVPSS